MAMTDSQMTDTTPEDAMFARDLQERAKHAQEALAHHQAECAKWSRILTMCEAALMADPANQPQPTAPSAMGHFKEVAR